MKLTALEHTFLDLAAIDEVHPRESKILTYIKKRLSSVEVAHTQDVAGNIVAHLPATIGETLALVGHVDIAAPLAGRKVIVEADIIKTDGTGLLGADDKAAVAVMIELADAIARGDVIPTRPIELIFTVGEEAGCAGAMALDMNLIQAKSALVLDWTGRVNHIVTKSPAYYKIDIEYTGRTAHPAEWQQGKNAGAALINAASALKQGEYTPGVTCNIGIFNFGQARNQVPGTAMLQAELRSYDTSKIQTAAADIQQLFQYAADEAGLGVNLSITADSPAYELNQSSELFAATRDALEFIGLKPNLEPTYGCFDGNILSARGVEVVMLGAGYYNPHSPVEYLDRAEFNELDSFVRGLIIG